jgi:pectinesterase
MRSFSIRFGLPAISTLTLIIGSIDCSKAQEASAIVGKILTVATDGSGDFKTVQEAVHAAPTDKNRRLVIRIKSGTYKEKLVVPGEKGPITFHGKNAATTILVFNDHADVLGPNAKKIGLARSASVLIAAPKFCAENITFENSAGPHRRAVAVNVSSDRAVFRKCRFLSWQDTLLISRNRQYFEDCYIAGSKDFIFGAATSWFEGCQLHQREDGYITAAATPRNQPYGYVFSNCIITGKPGVKTLLGRPWGAYARVTYLNTTMHDVIRPEGWDNWGKVENEKTVRYSEYGSKTPDGKLIDLSGRVAWAKRLIADEAQAITKEKVFGEAAKGVEQCDWSGREIPFQRLINPLEAHSRLPY